MNARSTLSLVERCVPFVWSCRCMQTVGNKPTNVVRPHDIDPSRLRPITSKIPPSSDRTPSIETPAPKPVVTLDDEYRRMPSDRRPKQPPSERFALFHAPHYMMPTLELTRRLGTYSAIWRYRYTVRNDWDYDKFTDAVVDVSTMVMQSIFDQCVESRLKILLDKPVFEKLAQRASTLTEAELKLFSIEKKDVYWKFLSNAAYVFGEHFTSRQLAYFQTRRVFQCMVVIYFIDDMPQLKEQTGQRLSMKTLTRDQYERVLVANIQMSRVLKPQLGDWKCTMLNFFQPYTRTSQHMFIN